MVTYSLFIRKHVQGFDVRIFKEISPACQEFELDKEGVPGWYKFEAGDYEAAKQVIYDFMKAGFDMLR